MSGHVGHHLRLSCLRKRPHLGRAFRHEHEEPHLSPSRTRLSAPSQRRNFGVADAAGYLLRGSEHLITGVHELTATPWFISLPLVAVVVTAVIRTPLAVYNNSIQRRKAKLSPLVQAQYAQIGLGLRKRAVPNVMERVSKAVKKRSKKMFSAFAINESGSIWGAFLGWPILLSNLEVIRRMCGGPRGLFGSLLYGWDDKSAAAAATATDSPPNTDLGAITASSTSPDVLSELVMEPTFATGGCLWFPDLLLPDPYHILPFAVSGLLIIHLLPETEAGRRALFGLPPPAGTRNMMATGGQAPGWRALRRALMVMSLAVGPLTMDMPSALHLYWLSSAGCSLAVTKGIKKLMPIPKSPVRPCRGMDIPLLRPNPN